MGDDMYSHMDKSAIISALRANKEQLSALGVKSMALFGSIVREQTHSGSDIDLAAIYDENIVRDLLDIAQQKRTEPGHNQADYRRDG